MNDKEASQAFMNRKKEILLSLKNIGFKKKK
jgi:hypothetical protein